MQQDKVSENICDKNERHTKALLRTKNGFVSKYTDSLIRISYFLYTFSPGLPIKPGGPGSPGSP
jgi:hypothetical protein